MQQDSALVVQKELTAGEHLMWSGRPKNGIVFRAKDVYMVPFSILWCGFAIHWTFSVMSSGAPLSFWIFGFVFVCVGLYFVFGRFIYDMIIRSRTYYGLTNQRVLIITGTNKIKSIDLKGIAEINIAEKKDKSGTITFGSTQVESSWMSMGDWTGNLTRSIPRFELIENVRQVFEMAREVQKKLQE